MNDKDGRPTGSEEMNKIFVGGLSQETTPKSLADYFVKYGELISCKLKTDSVTGKSRGFAFIEYASKQSIRDILSECPHVIDKRRVDVKEATLNPPPKTGEQEEQFRKLFIGGIRPSEDESAVRAHFEEFGEISKFSWPDFVKSDGSLGKQRYLFIIFRDKTAVENARKIQYHHLPGGSRVEVKASLPRQEYKARQMNEPSYGGGWGAGPQGGWNEGGGGGGAPVQQWNAPSDPQQQMMMQQWNQWYSQQQQLWGPWSGQQANYGNYDWSQYYQQQQPQVGAVQTAATTGVVPGAQAAQQAQWGNQWSATSPSAGDSTGKAQKEKTYQNHFHPYHQSSK